MFKKIFLLGLLGMAGIYLITVIPKPIAKAGSEFLIIVGIVGFILAIAMFGFKEKPQKLWWE